MLIIFNSSIDGHESLCVNCRPTSLCLYVVYGSKFLEPCLYVVCLQSKAGVDSRMFRSLPLDFDPFIGKQISF